MMQGDASNNLTALLYSASRRVEMETAVRVPFWNGEG